MAVGARTDSAPPSLQRLLSLDKTFDLLDQRIQEAARILALPGHIDPERELLHVHQPDTRQSPNPARHEFVLRWLLDKLKTQPDARRSPLAWSTLYAIFRHLPSPIISKALLGTSILPTIAQTLAEVFPGREFVSSPAAAVAEGENASEKSAKKRKRNVLEKEKPQDQPGAPLDQSDSRSVFLSIAALLRLLLDRSEQPDSCVYTPVHSQIASILRLDSAAFASLLKHWLIASLLVAPGPETPVPDAQSSLLSAAVRLMFDLLSLQSTSQPDSADSFDTIFCRECVSPAAFLISKLHVTSRPTVAQSAGTTASLRVLERLLAQQLFVPARAAFHAAREDQLAPTKRSARRNQTSLSERLDTFRADLARLAAGADPELLSTAQYAIPHLLDVAIRCTPTSTPRQRIAEAPWIDALFTALCNVLPSSTTSNSALAAMLDVMVKRKLSLSSALLIKLISERADLLSWGEDTLPSAGQPDFDLVAKVLAMDSSIFTDAKSTCTRALFQALTAHGISIEQLDSEAPVPMQALLCRSIAVSLMKAFARIRNLRGFVDQWLSQLSVNNHWEGYSWFIWTDSQLQLSLRDVLEGSLTDTQIAELVDSCYKNLTSASAVILNAVVGAVHGDSTIGHLQPTLERVIGMAQYSVSLSDPGNAIMTRTLLELLSRLYLLWFPVWCATRSQQDVETRLGALVGSSLVKRCVTIIQATSKSKGPSSDREQAAADAAFGFVVLLGDLLRLSSSHQHNFKMLMGLITFSAPAQKKAGNTVVKLSIRPLSFFTSMTQFPHSLQYLTELDRKEVFQKALHVASHGSAVGIATIELFVDTMVSQAPHDIRDELFTTILDSLSSASKPEADAAGKLLMQWSGQGLARQQREKILDLTVETIIESGDEIRDLQPQLSLMVTLMDQPNATANIATDPSIVWQLASIISKTRSGDLTLDLYEEFCSLLFKHIIDTKEQERSEVFLNAISKSLADFMDTKQPPRSVAAQLRLLAAFVKGSETRLDETILSALPHRSSSAVDSLVKRLYQSMSASVERKPASESDMADMAVAVRFYNSMPPSLLASGGSSSSKYAKRFTKLLDTLLAAPDHKSAPSSPSDEESVRLLPLQVQSYQHLAPRIAEQDTKHLCETTESLLRQDLDAKDYHAIVHSFSESASSVSDTERLLLIGQLLTPKIGLSRVTAENISLVHCLIMSIQSTKDIDGSISASVLTRLLKLLRTCDEFDTHCELRNSVVALLRNKPVLVTQYGIEMTISALVHLMTPSAPKIAAKRGHVVFEGLCDVTRSLLQFHRASLGGRYHLFIPLLERLLACLFTPASRDSAAASRFKQPAWLDNRQHPLSVSHAQRVSRLLENLCNPQQSDVSKRRRMQDAGHDLVDMTRKSRIQVGQHVQYILHYLCTFLLNGRLGEGMRDALTPGLWAVIDVTEMGADESRGVKALSASMNHAERAILRGVFEDWRRFGSWSG